MTIINKFATVAYSVEQMYALVNDIEKYSQFVPHCISSQVLVRSEDEVRAMLTFSGGGMHKSFTTLNRLQAHKMIEIRLINGPFHHLEGFWAFESLSIKQCRVILNLEFELSSRLLRVIFGPVFQQITNMLVDAFQKRAAQVYL